MDNEADSKQEPGQAPEAGAVPAGDEHPEATHPEYGINIYRDWCKSCGICAAFCQKQVLGRDDTGAPVVVNPDACIGCGWCELHCPDFAISVRPKKKVVAAEDAD